MQLGPVTCSVGFDFDVCAMDIVMSVSWNACQPCLRVPSAGAQAGSLKGRGPDVLSSPTLARMALINCEQTGAIRAWVSHDLWGTGFQRSQAGARPPHALYARRTWRISRFSSQLLTGLISKKFIMF